MVKTFDKEIWYNGSTIMGYMNALMLFVIGGRGTGKTYWYKRRCIKKFINSGERWVYMRRYKTELKMKHTILDDVSREFPNHEFEIKGFEMFCDGKSMGYIVSLSTNKTGKGMVFDNIKTIVYDEFMFDSTAFYRYIDNEVEIFMEMFESIARLNDDVRAVFLANSISIVNPYFLYYDIEPTIQRKGDKEIEHIISKKNTNGVLLITEVYYNDLFVEQKEKTKFGRLISGTSYGEYLIDNKMKNDSTLFIDRKPEDAKYQYTIKYHGFMFGVWYSVKNGCVYVSPKHDPLFHTVYCFSADDFTGKEYMAKSYKDYPDLKALVFYFKDDKCRFDSLNMKSMFFGLMKVIKCF